MRNHSLISLKDLGNGGYNLHCRICYKKILGLTNKARHVLARDGKRYNNDCGQLYEVSIEEA